jgi:hypothetical protein
MPGRAVGITHLAGIATWLRQGRRVVRDGEQGLRRARPCRGHTSARSDQGRAWTCWSTPTVPARCARPASRAAMSCPDRRARTGVCRPRRCCPRQIPPTTPEPQTERDGSRNNPTSRPGPGGMSRPNLTSPPRLDSCANSLDHPKPLERQGGANPSGYSSTVRGVDIRFSVMSLRLTLRHGMV